MNIDALGKILVGDTFDSIPTNALVRSLTRTRLGRDQQGDDDAEWFRMMHQIAAEGHELAAQQLRK